VKEKIPGLKSERGLFSGVNHTGDKYTKPGKDGVIKY
jgi:hypothetical protein